jgi:hypothetical protein
LPGEESALDIVGIGREQRKPLFAIEVVNTGCRMPFWHDFPLAMDRLT